MTVNSEAQIANLALQHLGERTINSLSDDTKPARSMNTAYVLVRQTLLRRHPWTFARKTFPLQRLQAVPLTRYDYAYALPDDFLKVVALNAKRSGSQPNGYEIEGRSLLTNAETANLTYVYDVKDVTIYDSDFVAAFAVMLAIKTCREITGSDEKLTGLQREAQSLILPQAEADDSSESMPERPWYWDQSRLIRSRYHNSFSNGDNSET